MKLIQNSSRLAMLTLVVLLCITGCKSKKKALEASNAAAEKARIEREEALRKQKEEELRAEEQRRKEKEAEEARRLEEERKRNEAKASTPAAKLNQYFAAISGASSPAAANSSINEALSLFTSPEAPVLIIISESGGQKDYDRPTTIKNYLNYLKDQKKNINKIANLGFDGAGKITEVELTKN